MEEGVGEEEEVEVEGEKEEEEGEEDKDLFRFCQCNKTHFVALRAHVINSLSLKTQMYQRKLCSISQL